MTAKEEIGKLWTDKQKEQEKRTKGGKFYSIKLDDEIKLLEQVLYILNKHESE